MSKLTVAALQARKGRGPRITRINCYDYLSAQLVDAAGIDMVGVGESVGRLVLGYPNVEMVTFDEILHHARAVGRGVKRAVAVSDLPLSSQTASPGAVVEMARRLIDAGMDAVKVEGGDELLPQMEALTAAGIAVHGTLRWDRQHADPAAQAREIVAQARRQEAAGCFMLSLAFWPGNLAAYTTARLGIPTVGISSGAGCDGQVLIIYDALGLAPGPQRPMTRAFANLREQAEQGLQRFRAAVQSSEYPDPGCWQDLNPEQWTQFEATIGG